MIDQATDQAKGVKQKEPSSQVEHIPQMTDQATKRPSDQATKRPSDHENRNKQILNYCFIPQDMKDIMSHLGYRHRHTFRLNYIQPLLEEGLLSMTIPDNPKHSEQKYITTEKGKVYQSKIII